MWYTKKNRLAPVYVRTNPETKVAGNKCRPRKMGENGSFLKVHKSQLHPKHSTQRSGMEICDVVYTRVKYRLAHGSLRLWSNAVAAVLAVTSRSERGYVRHQTTSADHRHRSRESLYKNFDRHSSPRSVPFPTKSLRRTCVGAIHRILSVAAFLSIMAVLR